MDFGTFSMLTVEFSTVKMGIFGMFVLILFYSYGGTPNVGFPPFPRKRIIFYHKLVIYSTMLYDVRSYHIYNN